MERLFLAGAADAAARPAYYRAFLEGSVIVMDANPPDRTPTGAGDLRIRTLQVDGVTHLPVFTSMARVEAYGYREGHCLEIRTRALLDAVPDTPVVVNPGSAYYMGFSRQEVAALLAGRMFRSNEPNQHRVAAGGLELAPLTDPPFALLSRMVALFRARPAVRAAHAVSVRSPSADEKPHPLIGVDAECGWDKLIREVMEIIDTHAPPGMVVDVCQLDDRPFSTQLRQEGNAFYRRTDP